MKPIKNKNFTDYTEKEQGDMLLRAAKGANKMQRDNMKEYEKIVQLERKKMKIPPHFVHIDEVRFVTYNGLIIKSKNKHYGP